jgi:hypothetical protein
MNQSFEDGLLLFIQQVKKQNPKNEMAAIIVVQPISCAERIEFKETARLASTSGE